MKKIRLFLFIVISASLLAGYVIGSISPAKEVDESFFLNEVAPDVVFDGKKTGHYPSSVGVAAFNTYDISPDIKGYAGPIKILLSLSPAGEIIGIKILSHRETPNYVHRMETPEFLRQFLGKSVNDVFEVDKDIDAISRATVSVKALADTVRESSRIVASMHMGIKVEGAKTAKAFDAGWMAYMFLFLCAATLYFMSRKKTVGDKFRDVIMAASIIITGLWLASPFSILHVFNVLLLRYSTDVLWIAVFASTALSILIAGRLYCGWLCPFGAISEFTGRLPAKKWEIPDDTDDKWRNSKYYLFGFIAVAVLTTGQTGFGNFETYVTLFSRHGGALTWSIAVLSLLANIRVKRLWCRYLCPVAALTGALSREAPGYASGRNCPMDNKTPPLISECIRCNRCYRNI